MDEVGGIGGEGVSVGEGGVDDGGTEGGGVGAGVAVLGGCPAFGAGEAVGETWWGEGYGGTSAGAVAVDEDGYWHGRGLRGVVAGWRMASVVRGVIGWGGVCGKICRLRREGARAGRGRRPLPLGARKNLILAVLN